MEVQLDISVTNSFLSMTSVLFVYHRQLEVWYTTLYISENGSTRFLNCDVNSSLNSRSVNLDAVLIIFKNNEQSTNIDSVESTRLIEHSFVFKSTVSLWECTTGLMLLVKFISVCTRLKASLMTFLTLHDWNRRGHGHVRSVWTGRCVV